MDYIYLIVGIALLAFGRKFFWLFTGAIGFFLGFTFAPQILPGQSENVIMTIAVVLGLLGVFLAFLIKSAAIRIAGFAAGAYILYTLLPMVNIDLGNLFWLIVIIGGVLGSILAGTMFDWALILLTTASGAMLTVQSLNLTYPLSMVVLAALFVVGLIIQGNIKAKE